MGDYLDSCCVMLLLSWGTLIASCHLHCYFELGMNTVALEWRFCNNAAQLLVGALWIILLLVGVEVRWWW